MALNTLRNGYSFFIHADFNSVLEKSWLELSEVNEGHLFQSLDWCKYVTKLLSVEFNVESLSIVVIRDRSLKPVMLMPLWVRESHFRVTEFIGGWMNDYNEFLTDGKFKITEQDFFIIIGKIRKLTKCDFVYLRNFTFDEIGTYKGGFRSQGLNSYEIDLKGGFDAVKLYASKKMLKDNKRNLNSLTKNLNAKFFSVASIEEYNEFVAVLITLKSRRDVSLGRRDISSNAAIDRFFRFLFSDLGSTIQVQAFGLIVEDNFVAMHLGLIHKNRFYYLFPAIDDSKFKKYSPGRILLEGLVSDACSNNVNDFDFGVGAEGYKQRWNPTTVKHVDLCFPVTFWGYCCSTLICCKNYSKQFSILKRLIVAFRKFASHIKQGI